MLVVVLGDSFSEPEPGALRLWGMLNISGKASEERGGGVIMRGQHLSIGMALRKTVVWWWTRGGKERGTWKGGREESVASEKDERRTKKRGETGCSKRAKVKACASINIVS